jgi:dolichol-phosphate mannosyltransferase
MIKNLWLILPVYNEEQSISYVVREWFEKINNLKINYTICIINDGSKDNTLSIINHLANELDNIVIMDKENSGHGQTCVYGYKYALQQGADWIFQIDSDGQCDVRFFETFIENTGNYDINIFGNRTSRDDGFNRVLISKFVQIFTLVSTRYWIKDGNVPYRMMSAKELEKVIHKIPTDFHLANILLSVLLKKESNILWLPIHFKKRYAGNPSVKSFSFVKHGLKLFKQLKNAVN